MLFPKLFDSGRLVLLIALFVSAGCAPGTLRQGVPFVTRKHKATDASVQRVSGYECLRVDSASLDQLDRALLTSDAVEAKAEAVSFLRTAHAASVASTRNELDRLDDVGWEELNRLYRAARGPAGADARAEIWQQFSDAADVRYLDLQRQVAEADTAEDVHRVLRPVRSGVQPSVKTEGRFLRAAPWLLFTIPSVLAIRSLHENEYRGPQDDRFASAIRWTPPDDSPAPAGIDAETWALLQRFAPILVQEIPEKSPDYDPAVDHIGTVQATDRQTIAVDTNRPAVYAYARTVRIAGRDHAQLIYTQWYPAHPALKHDDPERGHLEGTTLRVTLDRDGEPAVFETMHNCGCYHRTYPSRSLEAAAASQFGEPEKGKAFAIERNVPWKIDLIVPKLVEVQDDPRPVVRARAGWHGLIDVAMSEGTHADEPRVTVPYTLRPYSELEHLPLPTGGYTSMFYDNGLAKGAQRPEGIFFTPVGILSAGQPRQRGTQLIHWDHYDFDDPHLLERTLRLPSTF